MTSIVGRFLEHSRIYYFRNGGDEEVYLGSADLMQRNLDRRVEVLFPVRQASLCDRIQREILATYLADTVKARRMNSDGTYTRMRVRRTGTAINSQEKLLPATKTANGSS